MAGTFTNHRKGLISQARYPTSWNETYGSSTNRVFLPAGRDLDVVTGEITSYGSNGNGFITSPVDTVTSWRSGGHWDSVNPDLASYRDDLFEISRGKQPDMGHEFNSVHQSFISHDTGKQLYAFWQNGSWHETYSGELAFRGLYRSYPSSSLFLNNGKLVYPTVPDVDLAWGTKAIASIDPTKSSVSLMTDLLEIRDGLPKFPGLAFGKVMKKSDLLRASSSEFLNYVFGVTPLVSDMKGLLKSIVNFNKVIKQYSRDSDKIVRRRFDFPTRRSITTSSWSGLSGDTVVWFPESHISNRASGATTGLCTLDASQLQIDKIWFSGAFRYHLPLGNDLMSRMERISILANKLFGSNLDVYNIWAALPWSWLVDWFVDVGDIIRNATSISQYQGVMQYGYLMCESTYTNTYTLRNIQFSGTGYKTDLTSALMTKRKQRRKATPFGFGLNPSTFSTEQWAILGALGLSKAPTSLW